MWGKDLECGSARVAVWVEVLIEGEGVRESLARGTQRGSRRCFFKI